MATREEEIQAKIAALAVRRYGSSSTENLKKLFQSYDRNNDNALDKDEVEQLVIDADISTVFSGMYADGVIDAIDQNGDRKLTWDEYAKKAGIPGTSGPSPTTPTTPSKTLPTYDQWKAGQTAQTVANAPVAQTAAGESSFGTYVPWVIAAGGLGLFLLLRRR